MRASKKVKGAVLLTAGAALILGAPTVYADSDTGSSNQGGLLNGVQLLNGVNLNIPVNACGVGALLGEGEASCRSAAGNDNGGNSIGLGHSGRSGDGADSDSRTSSHNDRGLINGLQVGNNLTGNVPVNACGVGALLADGEGRCTSSAGDGNGGSSLGVHSRGHRGHAGNGGDSDRTTTTHNRGGLLNGVQALNNTDLNVPVDLCGVGLLLADGEGNCAAKAGNDNGGSVLNGGRWYRGHDGTEYRDYRGHDGREWREDRGGRREYWGGGSWHVGSAGNGGSDDRDTSSSNRGGLLNGLQLLNNSDLNVPVTVCGLAVLGSAECGVDVVSGNRNGGDARGYRHYGPEVEGGYTHHRHWENEVLPHTGAAGLALLPFGLALVAGGVALRRRVSSQR
jgi:hypothetical protein